MSAEITSDNFVGVATTEEKLVIYDERAVEVQEIVMYNYGHSQFVTVFDFTDMSTEVPYYDYNADYPTFTFTVKMSENAIEWIEDLYVCTVDPYGDKTYVELTYDDESGLWVGSHDYESEEIPTKVGVAYNCSDEYYLIPDDDEWLEDLEDDLLDYYTVAYDVIDDALSEVLLYDFDESTGEGTVKYADPETGETEDALEFQCIESDLDSSVTKAQLEEEGYVPYDDSETVWLRTGTTSDSAIMEYVDLENYKVYWLEISAVKEENSIMLLALDDVDWYDVGQNAYDFVSNIKDLFNLPSTFSNAISYANGELTSLLVGFVKAQGIQDILRVRVNGNVDVLYSEVATLRKMLEAECADGSSKLSRQAIITAQSKINSILSEIQKYKSDCSELYANMAAFSVIQVLCAASVAAGVGSIVSVLAASGPAGWAIGAAVGGLALNYFVSQAAEMAKESCEEVIENNYNVIYGSITSCKDYILRQIDAADCDDDDDPVPEPKEESVKKPAEGGLDPSGYVYEAVPSNTLEGVTAVISYNDNGTTTEWDAEAYSQANPQVTDESGTFQWDVPAGEWIVSFTKDGYYSTDTSDSENANDDGWLPVPPPQVNIAVAMVSTASPTVESVIAYTDRIEIVFSQYMDMSDSDTASVLNSISVTRDGTVVDVIVTALDAEYDLEGTTQYATRFAVVPSDGVITDGMVVTVDGSAENYAGTPIGADYVSDALTVQARPTEISSDDSIEAVIHETTSIEVALMPAISGTTLTVESSSEDIVSVTTSSVTTDANGVATLQIEGQLPGAGVITVTEPISGVSTTIDISVVWEASNVAVEPVVATLDDGTVLTSGMTIPAGSVVALSTTTSGATIRYTVNDTCPKKDAALYYSEPIVIDEDTVLRVAAYLDGTYSSTIRIELTVDNGSCSHVSGEAVKENIVNATCTTDGSYDSVVYCSICGEELSRKTIVVPAAHTAGTAVRKNVVEATRTTEGSYDLVTYCTVCGEEISRETVTVPATGIDMVTVWLRTPADYSAVNNAIAKANALNSGDYTNFSDITDAINAVNWTYNALMQSYVNEMAEKIETAIANLIPVGTTTEEIEIQEPIEDTNTDTEDDDEEKPSETPESESNPTTGIALSLLPMMIAALAAASAKRR